jgi:hypothetical protein
MHPDALPALVVAYIDPWIYGICRRAVARPPLALGMVAEKE